MREMAMDLVKKSAKQASAKLQFCRIAFGAAGSAGSMIDMGEAGDVARAFVGEEKVKLEWQAPRENRPKAEVKLLLNMMLLGIAVLALRMAFMPEALVPRDLSLTAVGLAAVATIAAFAGAGLLRKSAPTGA